MKLNSLCCVSIFRGSIVIFFVMIFEIEEKVEGVDLQSLFAVWIGYLKQEEF